MTKAFRSSAAVCLRFLPTFIVCLSLPISVEARVIIEDPASPGFPKDPAFAAGSLIIPLDGLPVRPGDQRGSITVGGVQLGFETTDPLGLLESSSGACGSVGVSCRLPNRIIPGAESYPIFITITPPVTAFGIIGLVAECGAQVTFADSLKTEVGAGAFFDPDQLFLGAADLGGISQVTLNATCGATWRQILFVPMGGGQSDVAVNKKADAVHGVIGANARLSYGIDVTNRGGDTAHNVTAIDFPPPGVTVESASAGATFQPPLEPALITWSLGDLTPGGKSSVGLILTTPPFEAFSCEDTLLNIAEATSTGDANLLNNVVVTTTLFSKASRAARAEICDNGLDDDCDGFVDCNDPECAASFRCHPPIAPAPSGPGGPPSNPTPAPGPQLCILGGESWPPVCCEPGNFRFHGCGGLDPNFKEADPPTNVFGHGYAAPGQTIAYTIHYENIGTADAHDVSIVDPLHPNLDETTLLIHNGGAYDPATRVILWRDLVALPPHVPRSVSFSVNIKADAQPATRVRNRGTVVFPDAIASPRTDTNFVEHTIVDPRFPVVADLAVTGCTRTGPGSDQRKVTLVNKGFGFAYNVTAEILNPPAIVHATDVVARFVHPEDAHPDVLATVMPLSTSISADTVSFRTIGHRREREDDDDDNDDDRHRDTDGDTRHDPCDVFAWRIRYATSTGETLSKDVHPSIPGLCRCAGPAAGGRWRNHEAYESCVANAARRFLQVGLITKRQKRVIIDAAEHSACGRHKGSRVRHDDETEER